MHSRPLSRDPMVGSYRQTCETCETIREPRPPSSRVRYGERRHKIGSFYQQAQRAKLGEQSRRVIEIIEELLNFVVIDKRRLKQEDIQLGIFAQRRQFLDGYSNSFRIVRKAILIARFAELFGPFSEIICLPELQALSL